VDCATLQVETKEKRESFEENGGGLLFSFHSNANHFDERITTSRDDLNGLRW